MRLRPLAFGIALAVVAGCGSSVDPESVASANADPTPTATPTAAPSVTGRVAVDPNAQFVSYRRKKSQAYGSGQALVTGTLRILNGCLVLEPGHHVVAFNADSATFDGTTLVLEPLTAGDPAVRVNLGQKVSFGGGYSDFGAARTNPMVSIPRACAAIGSGEIAYVESW